MSLGGRKKKRIISPDDLHPNMAKGLTQGASAAEALQQFPVVGVDGATVLRHMTKDTTLPGIRGVPRPHFHAENASTGFIRQAGDRKLGDTHMTFTEEMMRALKAGMLCLRCLEPQPAAFADEHLPACEGVLIHGSKYMKERQIMDIAMEFEGNKHLGPSRPMREYLDEQELRVEKARFARKMQSLGHR